MGCQKIAVPWSLMLTPGLGQKATNPTHLLAKKAKNVTIGKWDKMLT